MANYVDDFESYGAASGLPAGWTSRWVSGATYSTVTDSLSGISLRSAPSAGARYFASLDSVNGDSTRDNFEVLARVRSSARTASVTHEGVAGRCSGSASSETGYVAGFLGREFRIGKYVSGTFTQLQITSGFNAADSTFYWIRLRGNGSTIQGRVWADGSGEPGTWTHSATDTSITAAGWCGFFAFGAPQMDCTEIAVATNGDTASLSGGGTQTLIASLFTNSNTYYTHTLTAAGVTLTAPLFTNVETFYSAVVSLTGAAYRPTGDIITGGWTATPGGTLASCIDETTANDTDYITSPDLSTPATLSWGPVPAGTYDTKVRAAYLGSSGQIRIRYLDSGGTDVGGSAWQTLTSSAVTYTLSATTTTTADRFRIEVSA